MDTHEVNKIVIIGWNNMTACLADGLKHSYPNCTIYCPDTENEFYHQAINLRLLDPLPTQKHEIYANADYVIINQNSSNITNTLKQIKSLLSSETCLIDFTPIKTSTYENIQEILEDEVYYISCFVFLEKDPSDLTISKQVFQDKIVAVISDSQPDTLQYARNFWNIFKAKIVPSSVDFFDEIIAETSQAPSLLATVFASILQQDSWADTLFFGFYTKNLRYFLESTSSAPSCYSENIVANKENVLRSLSFLKREISHIEQLLDDEDTLKLAQYIDNAHKFRKRL